MRPRGPSLLARAACLLVVVVLLALAAPRHGLAQSSDPPALLEQPSRAEQKIDGFPVLLDGQPILYVRRGIAGFSAEERAQTITRRLQRIANDVTLPVADLRIQESREDGSLYLRIGQNLLLTINERDAQASRMSQRQAAALAKSNIQKALYRYRQDRKPGQLLRHALYAAIASGIAAATCLALMQISGRALPLIGRRIACHAPGLSFRQAQIVSPAAISSVAVQILKLVRVLLLLVLFFWAAFILRLFPWTRALGESFLTYFFASGELVLAAIANYLPNLFLLAITGTITFYVLRAIKPLFTALERGNLAVPGFYPEWASPTYNILALLIIAVATILGFPYLPGFGSPAFRGISVFLGLLLSLGSTSLITNLLGGIILIYTRALRIGDHIRVGDVIGDIIEKNFLAIRICTPANQIITIPNASLLANNVINFNISSRELSRSLALQSTVSLGYDVPWRLAYASLVEAALATEHILPDPPPFVLQTELADHAISYQLNAFTDDPNRMMFIYSELHQNIQDKFKEHGIEILSPGYTALRDGNASTIPAEPQRGAAQTPPFHIAMVSAPPPQP
ncbi:MAG: mechanosensitive ion channel family protein [Cyanobacteriota bacterium]